MKDLRRLPRLVIQLAFLLVAAVLLWPALPWAAASRFVAQASPFVAICSAVANRAVGIGTGIGLVVAFVTVMRRRWFCRYVCPTGLLLEGASRIGLRKTSYWAKWPPLGQYAAILTLVGAVVGYPVLLWMDPISIFSSPFAIRSANDWLSGIAAGAGLGILIVATLWLGTVWCVRICPLGGTQDLLALCSRRRAAPSAGTVSTSPPPPSVSGRMSVGRRAVLAGAFGVGLGLWARRVGVARADDTPLRPPGSAPEEHFTGLCIRCGNCVRACPSFIIRPDLGQAGLAGLLAPHIRYDKKKYCLENCNACTQVCPSGALQPLDLKHKRSFVIGEALVDTSLCLLTLGKKDCDACMRACPFDAVRIFWDEQQYVAYPVIDPKKCNGCGACEVACPTQRVKAIRVWKAPKST